MEKGVEYKWARKYLGLNQEDIAEEMLLTKQSISNIESGRVKNQSSIKFYGLVLEKLFSEKGEDYIDFTKRLKEELSKDSILKTIAED